MQIHLDGPVMTVSAEHTPKARLVIERSGKKDTYQFTDTSRDIFPMKYGPGVYTVKLCEPKYINVYRVAESKHITVYSSAWDTAPNQYVYYTPGSGCVQLARTMVRSADVVMGWIKNHIAYDYIRAATIPKRGNVLPDIDRCFDQRRGICLDIAGMMVAMLRSMGIASRLEIGKCGRMNHAWVRLADGTLCDPTKRLASYPKKAAGPYKAERFY